jgi:hypothetical protein
MTSAEELVQLVEMNGGRLSIEGEELVISPSAAAASLLEELRAHKPEILALLRRRRERATAAALEAWLVNRCVFRDRCWGGIGSLHVHFCCWCAERGEPMIASREWFENMLAREGFGLDLRYGFVYGLLLAEDAETCPPTPKITPNVATPRLSSAVANRR